MMTFHVTKATLNSLLAAMPQSKGQREDYPMLAHAVLYEDGTMASTDRYSLVVVSISTPDPDPNPDPDLKPVALLHWDLLKTLVQKTPARTSLTEGYPLTIDADGIVRDFEQTILGSVSTRLKPEDYPRILKLIPNDDPQVQDKIDPKLHAGLSTTTLNTALKVSRAMDNQNFFLSVSAHNGKAFKNVYFHSTKTTVTLVTMPVRRTI